MNGICHVEIPCTDLDRAGKFYTDVFGWEVTPMQGMNYSIFKAPDGVGGGLSTEAKVTEKPGVYIYIEVEDIDATLKKIEENGGKGTHPKTQVSPEHGYYAAFTDVEGNGIGLWSKQ